MHSYAHINSNLPIITKCHIKSKLITKYYNGVKKVTNKQITTDNEFK